MRLLSIVRAKHKEEQQSKEQRVKKAISSAGAAFLGVGVVGLVIFGYEIVQQGGLSSLTGMAAGVGLILSLVTLIAGIYMK